MWILFQLMAVLLPLLASCAEIVAEALQAQTFLLVQSGLSVQFPAACVETGQFSLNGEQLVLTQSFHLLLQGLEVGVGLAEAQSGFSDRRTVPLFLGFDRLLPLAEILEGLLRGFKSQHHLLPLAQLQLFAQFLVLPGLGAVPLQPLAAAQQLLFDQATALLTRLNVIELASGLFDAGVEQRDPCELIDQAAPVAVAH